MASHRAFTLIELLIVIAIIAILALIAVPNFLEAQTRAKVTAVYSDFRTLRAGLETYHIDNGAYPVDYIERDFKTWTQLTTPIRYVESVFYTPFRSLNNPHNEFNRNLEVYDYGGNPGDVGASLGVFYFVLCPGPDERHNFPWGRDACVDVERKAPRAVNWVYDPTNGTLSSGDILMSNRSVYYF